MARTALDIIVKVIDGASQQLNNINKQLKLTGDNAKKTGIDMIQFNRSMFATTAFLGIIQNQFRTLNQTLMKGAELGRVQDQFEAVLGPKGALFDSIDQMTGASIDKVEAMRSAIALKTLGVANSVQDISQIIVGAGVAAKRAGLDSSEGIQKITQALKDGNLSNLEFLNLLRTNDAGLKAQLSILHKYTGVLGGAITAQQKHALILNIISRVARSAKDEQKDLYDILFNLGQAFNFARAEIGRFLGQALTPAIEGLTKLFDSITKTFSEFRKSKEIVFFAKALLFAAGAATTLYTALYTTKMIFGMLTSLGFGVPRLILAFTGLGAIFLGITNKAETLTDKIRVFGAFLKGIYELVESFDPESGLGKISETTARLLEEHGLMGFVKNISRATIVVKDFGQTVFSYIVEALRAVDSVVGSVTKKIFQFFGLSDKPWSRKWIDSTGEVYKSLAKVAAVIFSIYGAGKLLGLGGGLLSRIPIIGRFFGGAAEGPKGTASDPIYTRQVGGLGGVVGAAEEATKTVGTVGLITGILSKIGLAAGVLIQFPIVMAGIITAISSLVDNFKILHAVITGQKIPEMLSIFAGGKTGKEVVQQTQEKLGIFAPGQSAELAKQFLEQEDAFRENKQFFQDPQSALEESLGEIAKNRTALGLDTKQGTSLVGIPQYQKEGLAQSAVLGKSMQDLDENQKSIFREAWKEATADTSAGGTQITPDEWVAIYQAAINGSSLSEEMKKLVGETRNQKDKGLISTRRGC